VSGRPIMPWEHERPAQTLSANALTLIEYIRDTGDLARRYSRARAMRATGLNSAEIYEAEREIRGSVFAGQFRPYSRTRIPRHVRTRVFNRDQWACVICGERNQTLLTIGHHPIPYSRGGSDHHTNLRTECETCNNQLADTEPAPQEAS